jgi:hypothetical protein
MTASALVLVVEDDDHAAGAEGGRGLDLGHLAREEVIKLGVTVVDGLAVSLPVLAAVGDDGVEGGHVAPGQIGVEG